MKVKQEPVTELVKRPCVALCRTLRPRRRLIAWVRRMGGLTVIRELHLWPREVDN